MALLNTDKWCFCILLLLSSVLSSSIERELEINIKRSDPLKYRLPGTTYPSSYQVTLTLDPSKETFDGKVEINIKVKTKTKNIVLHSDGLEITQLSLIDDNINGHVVKNYALAKNDTNFLDIALESEISTGNDYKLLIVFNGYYSKELDGIYRSFYFDESGNKMYLATTQFAAVTARRAFPCYDEPALKATFTFIIKSPKSYNVISNAKQLKNIANIDGFQEVTFEPTPLMSTYILGFSVSNFQSTSLIDEPVSKVEYKAYSRASVLNEMTFALQTAEKCIYELQKYLQLDYRLSKMDIVAVPDFKFSAMENWGIVDYKEEAIAYNEYETIEAQKQDIVKVISHENSHMWFGNEVTPSWWGYVWMKEGFATYFENYISDVLNKNWKIMDQFVPDVLQNVMVIDSFPTANPLSSTVASPSELMYNYNLIAYQKGASVIRMIKNVFGEVNFKEALQSYVKKLTTGVTDPSKFYEELQRVADNKKDILPKDVSVEELFGTWIDQPGYPILLANRIGDVVELQQTRYNLDDTEKTEKWWIPTRVTVSSSATESEISGYYFVPPNEIQSITVEEKAKWYLLDPQKTGYYRILYNEENWKDLTIALKKKEFPFLFHPVDRAQLIDDAFEFSKTGRLSYNITMELLQYLEGEMNYIPWISVKRGLSHLNGIMTQSSQLERYQKFVRNITSNYYKSLGFEPKENDSHLERLGRGIAIGLMCGSKDEDCMAQKDKNLVDFVQSYPDIKIHPELRATIMCAIVSIGEQYYDMIYDMYKKSNRAADKVIALKALGCAKQEELIKKNLMMTLDSEDEIRNHNRLVLLDSVINSGSLGSEKAMEFLYDNYLELQQKATVSTGLSSVIQTLSNKLYTPSQISKFTMLVVKYKNKLSYGEQIAVLNAMDTIHLNQRWLTTSLKDLDDWLIDNVDNNSSRLKVSYLLLCLPFIYKIYSILL